MLGILLVTVRFLQRSVRGHPPSDAYTTSRRGIGRALLPSIEKLVAGDIIRTVAISPTLENVTVLALIVLIRTFLSGSLELELNGRWPWQDKQSN